MARNFMSKHGALTFGQLALFSIACSSEGGRHVNGEIDFDEARPSLSASDAVPTYTGNNEFVLRATARHRTGVELHRNVIIRTCGPTQGVCHNEKEYPDLSTPGNLRAAISSACNVQSEWSAVFDGCEVPGDRLRLGNSGPEVEIGYFNYIPGEPEEFGDNNAPTTESPGLHIILQAPVDIGDRNRVWERANFIRKFQNESGELSELTFANYQSQWWLLEGGVHLFAEVQNYQVDRVNELLGGGVNEGDRNRNGVFGARQAPPLTLLEPGAPEESYLIGRLRGELNGESIPGTRMPLANEPLTIEDMVALFCFVEGISPDLQAELDLSAPINYEDCRAADDPEGLNLLGNGATWLGRVQPLLEANCGGCHGGDEPQADFDILSDGLYERLLGNSSQVASLAFIAPGSPEDSYLWLKLTGEAGILGQGMPIDPLEGVRMLPDGALSDIRTWIENGAFEEE